MSTKNISDARWTTLAVSIALIAFMIAAVVELTKGKSTSDPSCNKSVDCPSDTPICESNRCRLCKDGDCTPPAKCQDGKCVSTECNTSSDCPADNPICSGHHCRKCQSNGECPNPNICVDGKCKYPCPPCSGNTPICNPKTKACVPCGATHPCPPGLACDDGACVTPKKCTKRGNVADPLTNQCICEAGWFMHSDGSCTAPVGAGSNNCQNVLTDIASQATKVPGSEDKAKYPLELYQCTGVAGIDANLSGTMAENSPWALDQVYLDHYDDPSLKSRTFPGNQVSGTFDSKRVSLTNANGCYYPKQAAPGTEENNCSRGLRLTSLWIGPKDSSGNLNPPTKGIYPPFDLQTGVRDIGEWQSVGDTFFAHHKIWGKGGAGQWASNGAHTANIYPMTSGNGRPMIRLRCTGDLWGVAKPEATDHLCSSDDVPLTPGLYQVQTKSGRRQGTKCKIDAEVTDLDGGCGGSKWQCTVPVGKDIGICTKSKIPTSCYNTIGVTNGVKQQPTCWSGSEDWESGTGGNDECLVGTRCDGFKERVYTPPPSTPLTSPLLTAPYEALTSTSPSPPEPSIDSTNPPFDPAVAWNLGVKDTTKPNPTGLLSEEERQVYSRCGGCVVTQDIWGPGKYTFELKVPPVPHNYDGKTNTFTEVTENNPNGTQNVNIDTNCLSGYVFAVWLFTETELYTVFQPYDPEEPPPAWPDPRKSGDSTTTDAFTTIGNKKPLPVNAQSYMGSGLTPPQPPVPPPSNHTAFIDTTEKPDTLGVAEVEAFGMATIAEGVGSKSTICGPTASGGQGCQTKGYNNTLCACPNPPNTDNNFKCGDDSTSGNVCTCQSTCGRLDPGQKQTYPCAYAEKFEGTNADCYPNIWEGDELPDRPIPWWPSDQAMWSGKTTNACEGDDFKTQDGRDLDTETAGVVKVSGAAGESISFWKPTSKGQAAKNPLVNWQGSLGRTTPTCVPNNGQISGGGGQGSSSGGQSQEVGGLLTYHVLGCADPTCLTDNDCAWSLPEVGSTRSKTPTFKCLASTTTGDKMYCLPDPKTNKDLHDQLVDLYGQTPEVIANNCLSYQQQWQTGLVGAEWCGTNRSLGGPTCAPNMNPDRWHRSGETAVRGATAPNGTIDPEIPYFAQSAELGGDLQSTVWGGDNVYGVLNHEIDFEIPCNTPNSGLTNNRAGGAWGPETINLNTWLADNNSYTPTGPTPWYTQAMATYDWGSDLAGKVWPEGGITKQQCEETFRSQRSFMSKVDTSPTAKPDPGMDEAYTTITYEIDWWADEDPTKSYVKFSVGDGTGPLNVVYTTSRFVPTRGGRWIIGPWPARWGGGYRPRYVDGNNVGTQSNSQAWDYVYCDLLSASFRPYNTDFTPTGLNSACLKLRAVGNTYDQKLKGVTEGVIDGLCVKHNSLDEPDTAYAAMTCTKGTSGYDCEIRCGIRQLVNWSASTAKALFPKATYLASKTQAQAACTQDALQIGICPGAPINSDGLNANGAATAVAGSATSSSSRSPWFGVTIGTACAAAILIGVTIWLWIWVTKLKKQANPAVVVPKTAVIAAKPSSVAAKPSSVATKPSSVAAKPSSVATKP
jgi:hypothetical protein